MSVTTVLNTKAGQIGVGVLVLGAVVMVVWQARQPAFFRGETLKRDTPTLVA